MVLSASPHNQIKFLFRSTVLAILMSFSGGCERSPKPPDPGPTPEVTPQTPPEPPSPSPTPSPRPTGPLIEESPSESLSEPIAWILGEPNRKKWPRSLTIVSPVVLPIIIEGAEVGQVNQPAGASGALLDVERSGNDVVVTLMLSGSARKLPAEKTNLLQAAEQAMGEARTMTARELHRQPQESAIAGMSGGIKTERDASTEPEIPPPASSKTYSLPFGVGPKVGDRQEWKKARFDRKNILEVAESELTLPTPEITTEDYLAFSKTGSREPHGVPFRKRLDRVGVFALAAGLTNDSRFVEAAQKEAEAILDEPTWVIPAHDKTLENFRGEKVDVDLGVVMRGYTLATMGWWLEEKLPPDFVKRLKAELNRRVVDPYLEFTKGKKGLCWWANSDANWNAVCHAGVVGTAMYATSSRADVDRVLRSTRKLIGKSLGSHTNDGYCTEGIMYHNYGFGHYMNLAELLYRATDGGINLYQQDKVAEVAAFPTRFEVFSKVYPSFGDTPYGSRALRGLQKVLAHRLDNPALLTPSLREMPDLYGYDLIYDSILPATLPDPPKIPNSSWNMRDEFLDGGLLITRPAKPDDSTLGAAFKAGNNGEAHNHNDEGTFIVVTGDSAPLTDIGSEIYTASTFGDARYKSAANNSYGHSVPVVDGQLQRTGAEAQAKVVEREFTDSLDRYVVDLRDCYEVTGLRKLQREFRYYRGKDARVEVIDQVSFGTPKEFSTALMTLGVWREVSPGHLEFEDRGNRLDVEITASVPFTVTGETLDQLNLRGPKTPAQRVGILLSEPVREAEIKTVIRPKKS